LQPGNTSKYIDCKFSNRLGVQYISTLDRERVGTTLCVPSLPTPTPTPNRVCNSSGSYTVSWDGPCNCPMQWIWASGERSRMPLLPSPCTCTFCYSLRLSPQYRFSCHSCGWCVEDRQVARVLQSGGLCCASIAESPTAHSYSTVLYSTLT